MTKKQPSGAEKRKRRRAKLAALAAAGVLMPRITDLKVEDVSSLSALTSTRLRFLTEWLKKKLSTEDFGVFVKTLSEFRADAVARIQEREIANDERMADLLEAHEARASGLSLVPAAPALEQSLGPVGGELVPLETKADEVSE
jgi:hypothetical protein